MIIWDSNKFERIEKVLGSFSISVKLEYVEEGSFWLTSIYGSIIPLWREDFFMELQDLYGLAYPKWCIGGGDFNVIRRTVEKLGGYRITLNMRRFDELIRELELFDPPLRNASFTWSNLQDVPICKRLDIFLFTFEWDNLFPHRTQEALPRWTSDHNPICLDTNPFKWGPTPFRFEKMWLLHSEFRKCFSTWWQEGQEDGWEGHKFMRKLKFVKSKLKFWNKEVFGDLKERKLAIILDIDRIDLLEQEGSITRDLFALRRLRKKELGGFLLKEEVHWR